MRKIIELLIVSDVVILTAFGLVSPILAIFIKDSLIGGTIFAAGLAATIQLITKSALQLPLARYSDKGHRKAMLIIGSLIFSAVPFVYVFITHVNELLALQLVMGLGTAMAYPPWMALFSHYVDKNNEGFEWSVYSTAIGLGGAVAASIGGAAAMLFGFDALFLGVGIFSLLGTLPLCFLKIPEKRKLVKHRIGIKHKNHSLR